DDQRKYATVEEAFAQCHHRLLILGDPGAGKTTSLLRLAEQTLDTAEKDDGAPVPLVVNLSGYRPRTVEASGLRFGSWFRKQPVTQEEPAVAERDVERWLAEQMAQSYQVRKDVARRWLEEGRIAVFLDGLDEVDDDFRE